MGFARLGDRLTAREEEVLFGLADGRRFDEIGAELFLSTETIRSHSNSLRQKLGARNSAHAVALAYHHGLLRPKAAA